MNDHKSWDELLWLYITNDLSELDRQVFERYLAQSEARRAEVAQWDKLAAVVREDAETRVNHLPPLILIDDSAMRDTMNPSLNGSRSNTSHLRMERQDMTVSTTIEKPTRRFNVSLTLVATLLAVVLLTGLLFAANNLPPDDLPFGAGLDDNNQQPPSLVPSSTPTPTSSSLVGVVRGTDTVTLYAGPDTSYDSISTVSVGTSVQVLGQNANGTWYNVILPDDTVGWLSADVVIFQVMNPPQPAVVTGTPIPFDPPPASPTYNSADLSPTAPMSRFSVTATPLPSVTFTASSIAPPPTPLPPTIAPSSTALPGQQRDPLSSITPSVMQPIVSEPVRLAQQITIPNNDIATSVEWADGWLITGGYNGITLLEIDNGGSGGASTSSGVIAVAVSPDGDLLAALDWASNLTLWDISSPDRFEFITELADTPLWGDLVFSSDGSRLYSALSDEMYLEVATLELRQIEDTLRGFPYTNPDKTLAVVAVEGNAAIVDTTTLQPLVRLAMSMDSVQRVAFSDAYVVVFGQGEMTAIEIESGQQTNTVRVGGVVTDVAFSPDGRTVAYLTNNPDIRAAWIWDITQEAPDTILVFDAILNDLAFSPDGEHLAVASSEGRIFTLDI